MQYSELVKRTCERAGTAVPNMDPDTKIHYGVISANDLDQDGLYDVINCSENLTSEAAKEELFGHIRGEAFAGIIIAITKYKGTTQLDNCRRAGIIGARLVKAIKKITNDSEDEICDEIWDSVVTLGECIDKGVADKEAKAFVEANEDALLTDSFWQGVGNGCDGDEYLYSEDGLEMQLCRDGDIFVFKSPYYAFAPGCSPCAPCAGHLGDLATRTEEDPEYTGYLKTYCLDPEFYPEDSPPNFIIYNMDGTVAFNEPKEAQDETDSASKA
jgi:hypothetical protein